MTAERGYNHFFPGVSTANCILFGRGYLKMNAYCVILRLGPFVDVEHSRTKRCFLKAQTADRAMMAAAEQDPGWKPVGVEPSSMFTGYLRSDELVSNTDSGHAA